MIEGSDESMIKQTSKKSHRVSTRGTKRAHSGKDVDEKHTYRGRRPESAKATAYVLVKSNSTYSSATDR